MTFADGMGAETFTTKASSEQSQDVEQSEGTTIEQWSSEAKPIEKSVDDADENKDQPKEHIALTDGSKDGAEDNASSDGFNEPYDNNNKGSKNDNEAEPEADPTKVGGGADTSRSNDDTIDNSNGEDTTSSSAVDDEPIKDTGDIEQQSNIFISDPIDTTTPPIENTDTTTTAQENTENNNEENKAENETTITEQESTKNAEAVATKSEVENTTTAENIATISEAENSITAENIATISEIENIDIATDSEMENVEAPVFGAEDTVYYAIAKNPTNTSKRILYFSSTDLSTNSEIGEIEKSGNVGTYTSATSRPWGTSSYKSNIDTIKILDEIKPTSMAYWFQEMKAKFEGLDKINTSNVISMNSLFNQCRSLSLNNSERINLEHIKNWDVGNVTDMSYLFYSYLGDTLDLSGWNTSNVTNMSYMFGVNPSKTSAYLKTLNISGWDTSNVTNMKAMFYYSSKFTSLDLSGLDTSNVTDMSHMFRACYDLGTNNGTLNLTGSFNTQSVTDMSFMFYDCIELTSIDLSNFNTTNVTNMSSIFMGCKKLTSLNLTTFNTSNVTNMSDMFNGCHGLTSLDLSNFNTSKVTTIGSMFGACSGLTSLDLSNFNTSNNKSLYYTFGGCSGLTSLDLSNFNTSKVESMSGTFNGCSGLTSLNISCFDTSKVTGMYQMFNGCSSLTSLNLSRWNTSRVTSMGQMFNDCSQLTTIVASPKFVTTNVTSSTDMFLNCTVLKGGENTTYDSSKADKTYARIDKAGTPGYFTGSKIYYAAANKNGTKTLYFSSNNLQNNTEIGTIIDNVIGLAQEMQQETDIPWKNKGITKVVILDSVSPTSMKFWFGGYKANDLETIEGLSNLDISVIQDMSEVFAYTNLTSVDLSNLDTRNVTNMSKMFYDSKNLQSITFPVDYDTKKVTNMKEMFYNCEGLTTLDLSNVNTKQVTDMSSMFYNCKNLQSITFSQEFITNKVTDMSGMFSLCSALTSLDFTTFYTSYVTNMSDMFKGCSSLTTLDLQYFETNNVLSMSSMFDGCKKIENIKITQRFNTSKVTNMSCMFKDCHKLSTINSTILKTGNVTDMSYMFSGCNALQSLDVSWFNTSNVTNMSYMFSGCIALNSLYVYNFNTSKVTDMSHMFQGTIVYDPVERKDIVKGINITDLNLSNFDISNVTNMSYMFNYGVNFENITFSNTIDTSKVQDMTSMFEYCTSLKQLDLSKFNTANVKDIANMFSQCSSLASLTLSENFKTNNVSYFTSMFNGCKSLTSINLSSFDTSNAKSMANMFMGCSAIKVMDLRNFKTSAVASMSQMFADCSNLIVIAVSNDFVTTNVTNSTDMFRNCYSLMGCKYTTLTTVGNVTDKTYAKIDGGETAPGLLSDTPTIPALPVEIIDVSGLPNPSGEGDHIWPVGDLTTLDLSNLKVNVKYDDNSEKDINYTGNELNFSFAPQPLATTSTSLVITYKNMKATVSDIFVYEQSYAKDIKRTGGNVTTVYVPGDTFNPTGLEIEVETFGGDTTTIPYNDDTKDGFTFSPNPFLNPPETIKEGTPSIITVQYGKYGGCTYDIPIIVTKRAQGIEIEGGIDQYYTVGDTFVTTNIHNLVATVTNADNTVEVIKYAEHPEYYSFTPNLGTALTVNDNKITIKIKGVEKDYPIIVEPEASELQSIAVVAGSVKTDYIENQLFDPTGLKITATYTGNVTRTIEYNEETKNDFTFSPNPFATTPEKLTYGIDKVTITYKTTKSCDLGVTVRLRQVATISQVTGLVGTAGSTAPAFIASGSNIDLTTLQVTIGYDNGEVETKGCDGNEVKFLPEGPANPKATYKIETRGYEKVLGQDIIFVYTTEDKKEITGVTKQPTTTVYIPGEPFNPTGMEIQTKDFEGNTETIICTGENKDDFTIEPDPIPDNATDPTDIIVRYKDYEECKTTITVKVTPPAASLEVGGRIDKYYTVGDTFEATNIHDLVATATNADNTVEVIKYADNPEYFSFTPAFGKVFSLTDNNSKIVVKVKGQQKEYDVVVLPNENPSEAPTIAQPPTKTQYVEDEPFDPTGLEIKVKYPSGETRKIEFTEETKGEFTFSPNPFAVPQETIQRGTSEITIIYKGQTFTTPIDVTEKQVVEILSVIGLDGTAGSTATAFIASGSDINLTNLQVKVKYDNNQEATIAYDNNEIKFEPLGKADPNATYKIKARAKEKVLGQDIIFVYTTEDKKEITGVTKQPTTTVYIPGEPFNPTGMEIQTKDFEGNTETIICTGENKDDFTIEPDPIPNNATDPTDIIVRYKDYEECKTTITVKVTPPAASLEVGGRIDKYYTVGDTFEATNIHDLVATATNADNTVEVIKYADNPEYFSFTPAFGKVFSLADNNSKIVVKVKGQQKEYDVVVLPATSELQSIALVTGSVKTNYIENQLFDPTGLKITATYTGNATRTIEYNEETKNDFTFSPNPFAATPEKLVYGTDHVDITYNGKSTSVNVSVALRQVVDIKEVTGLPGQTATEPAFIKNGATIDLTNLQVKVEYNNGEEEIKSYNASSTEVQLLPTGPADATAVYKIKVRDYEEALDQSVIFVYTDEDKKEIIGINSQPTTTVYVPGETFDPTGLEINTKDFEGNTETITFDDTVKDNFTFSPNPFAAPPEPIAEGTTTIKVQYGNFDKSTIEIPITLLAKASLFTVNDAAIDKYYRAGDTFATTNIHNLVATVINTDATQETIKYTEHPEYFSFTPAIGTAFKVNDTKIIIKLRGVTCDYPIVVEPAENPTGATAGKLPTKTQYEDGEPFDPTGMIITVTYPGEVTRTIEYNDETKDDFTFSPNPFAVPPETLSSGNNQVEVKYRDKPFYVPVTIRKKMQSIAVKQGPTNKEYSVGDKFDPTGLVIEVTYTDTTTETIVYNSSTQSGFTFVPALDQAFTSTADKVAVSFGTIAPIDIDGLVIHKESISITIVNSDGTTTVVTDMTRDDFEKKLDEAIAKGAIGFHEYTADGINDAQKRYNRYTPPTMTKEQALDKFDDYRTGKVFIGASFPIPAPAPSPSRERGGNDGGGRSIITYDPQGNIQPGQQQEINKVNNIPQSNLVKNDVLAETLKSLAENVNRPIVNVKDESGDKGYGQWLHVPNTIIWMVMSGESTNTTKQEGNKGFLSNGWYNLSWKGRDEWYHFDKNGMMQLGWITENSKIYYLEEDLNSNWYGRRVTGPYTVKGVRYIFDQTGALIQ